MPSTRVIPHVLLIVAIAVSAPVSSVDAAEIVLRPKCQCGEVMVRLGDVADVQTDDQQRREQLAAVELFPTPAGRRYLDLEQLKDILSRRGINTSRHSFRGSTRTEIVPSTGTVSLVTYPGLYNPARVRVAEQRVESALLEYLQTQVDESRAWQVSANVTPDEAEVIAQRSARLRVAGGSAPWTGTQHFDVTVTVGERVDRLSVPAEVSTPEMVVFARRPLRQGEVVRQADVEMQPAPPLAQGRRFAYALDEIVGKELSRGYSSNQPIDPAHARAPRMVRRNDVITVYAVASGLRVRILGKALEDGALGDVIAVSDLKTRKQLRSRARVTGFQTVEIYALGPQAGADQPSRAMTPHASRPPVREAAGAGAPAGQR